MRKVPVGAGDYGFDFGIDFEQGGPGYKDGCVLNFRRTHKLQNNKKEGPVRSMYIRGAFPEAEPMGWWLDMPVPNCVSIVSIILMST